MSNHWHVTVYEGEPTPRRVVVRYRDAAKVEERIEKTPPTDGQFSYPVRRVEIVDCRQDCLGPEPKPKFTVV